MRNKFLVLTAVGFGVALSMQPVEVKAETYYARCNIKVVEKGNYVTWENFRTDKGQREIRVGSKVKVSGDTITDASGASATLKGVDVKKIAGKNPPNLGGKFASDVKNAVPKRGMTKAQVYMALCAPMYVDGKNSTKGMTYDEIMKADQWIWKRMTFAKNIGVRFDSSGKAAEVEGVYGK